MTVVGAGAVRVGPTSVIGTEATERTNIDPPFPVIGAPPTTPSDGGAQGLPAIGIGATSGRHARSNGSPASAREAVSAIRIANAPARALARVIIDVGVVDAVRVRPLCAVVVSETVRRGASPDSCPPTSTGAGLRHSVVEIAGRPPPPVPIRR